MFFQDLLLVRGNSVDLKWFFVDIDFLAVKYVLVMFEYRVSVPHLSKDTFLVMEERVFPTNIEHYYLSQLWRT